MKKSSSKWSDKAKEAAIGLHSQLKLDDTNWHQLKDDSERRSAELLSGAMVQLLSGGNHSEITELINQSLKWLKKEIKAPSCPKR